MNSLGRLVLPVSRAVIFKNKPVLFRSVMTTSKLAEKAMENLKSNPYFEKYAKKIATLQETSPEEFLSKLQETEIERRRKAEAAKEEERKCALRASESSKIQTDTALQSKPKSLATVMKMELIEGKSAEEIKQIWYEYYGQKDGVAAVVPAANFLSILENSRTHPLFLFPLPRSNGYEFVVCQFAGNDIHFTTLINYQTHKENAPECLTLTHYTDLIDSKGIVLMRGEFDTDLLTVSEAQCLANQVQLYYGIPTESKKRLLDTFTNNPSAFKFMDLVSELENLTL
ncbi:ATP synthase mitochondrial F1 complex assembly factor 1 [Cloeon dipterum]|uniref:ATP synthase mitochondrial F1 complex assembly factor 1 n=1 Tax=Cloeon dipterum TaxID=197152 RepID=UPI00322056F1